MTLQGHRQLNARLKALGATRPIMRTFQLDSIAEAKRLVPRKTGHLERSILPGSVSDSHADIQARTPYAAAVEFGAKPHVIRPKKASILAWPASEGGRRLSGRARKSAGPMIFARKVNHPGSKAQPYLIPGARSALGKLRDALVKRWDGAA